MSRTILLLCCWLLVPSHHAVAANGAAREAAAPQSASSTPAVKPLIIPAAKPTAKSTSAPAKPASQSTQIAASKKASKAAETAKSLPANAKPTRSSAARTKLAPIKLNLSLPPELVKGMGFRKPVAELNEVPVLPPMFGEAKSEPSAYQLSGKLITNERQTDDSDNYFNSVEGAQLSIEFRQ
jgi:cell wall-associated NlpC family hydrolase